MYYTAHRKVGCYTEYYTLKEDNIHNTVSRAEYFLFYPCSLVDCPVLGSSKGMC